MWILLYVPVCACCGSDMLLAPPRCPCRNSWILTSCWVWGAYSNQVAAHAAQLVSNVAKNLGNSLTALGVDQVRVTDFARCLSLSLDLSDTHTVAAERGVVEMQQCAYGREGEGRDMLLMD